jgi:UDP-glucose/GDP-mannose dehydrogenase family, NAD binding domain
MTDQQWDLKILCMGAGYVGGPTMAVIAKQCPKVGFFGAAKPRNNGPNLSNRIEALPQPRVYQVNRSEDDA